MSATHCSLSLSGPISTAVGTVSAIQRATAGVADTWAVGIR